MKDFKEFNDIHTCNNCNREFEWEYFVPDRVSCSSRAYVHIINENRVHPRASTQEPVDNKLKFKCRCPYCDKENNFIYDCSDK